MALTGKKQRFADAVLAGLSNKDAAIKAGYSAATASAAGARLVKDKDVSALLVKKRKAAEKPAKGAARNDASVSGDASQYSNPLRFLEAVMCGTVDANMAQIKAATAMLPYLHQKLGEGGKKDQKNEAAKQVASRFGRSAPPKLVAAGGKKV